MPKCRICGLEVKKKEKMILVESKKYVCSQECESLYKAGEIPKTDREQLLDYINELYGGNANFPVLATQIKRLQDDYNMKEKGMLLALQYYIEIEGNTFDEEYNIKWIIEKYYPIAREHYVKCMELQKKAVDIKEDEVEVITVKKLDFGKKIDYSIDMTTL